MAGEHAVRYHQMVCHFPHTQGKGKMFVQRLVSRKVWQMNPDTRQMDTVNCRMQLNGHHHLPDPAHGQVPAQHSQTQCRYPQHLTAHLHNPVVGLVQNKELWTHNQLQPCNENNEKQVNCYQDLGALYNQDFFVADMTNRRLSQIPDKSCYPYLLPNGHSALWLRLPDLFIYVVWQQDGLLTCELHEWASLWAWGRSAPVGWGNVLITSIVYCYQSKVVGTNSTLLRRSKASANQRLSCHRVRRVLSSAHEKSYK